MIGVARHGQRFWSVNSDTNDDEKFSFLICRPAISVGEVIIAK